MNAPSKLCLLARAFVYFLRKINPTVRVFTTVVRIVDVKISCLEWHVNYSHDSGKRAAAPKIRPKKNKASKMIVALKHIFFGVA